MSDRVIPKPPTGLKTAGRKLWRRMHEALADDVEFDERELTILETAARQADDVARLERALKTADATVAGSTGQVRLHPAVAELRQGRLALARLLATFELDTGEATQRSEASRRGRKAADARWRRQDELAQRRKRLA